MWISSGREQVEMPEFTLTGPTDKGARKAQRSRPAPPPVPAPTIADELEDMATDEAPSVLLRLAPALPPAAFAPDSLPPLRLRPEDLVVPAALPTPTPSSDEQSTGLFESWDWDEADPYTTGEFPSLPAGLADLSPTPSAPAGDAWLSRSSRSAPPRDVAWEREMTGPRLAVVQDAPVEEDYEGVRAEPMPIPPRPHAAEAGGPLRPFRPAPCDVPADWLDDERQDTLIVIDPTLRAPGRPWAVVALMDAGAWAVGFSMTFLVGLVTAGSAGAVLVALGA